MSAKKLRMITIPPSSTNFEIRSSYSHYRISNLRYAKTEIWGRFYESIGGDLPPNSETLHLNWLPGCDSSYNDCKVQERFTLMQAYGSVKWENYELSNGQYLCSTCLLILLRWGLCARFTPVGNDWYPYENASNEPHGRDRIPFVMR